MLKISQKSCNKYVWRSQAHECMKECMKMKTMKFFETFKFRIIISNLLHDSKPKKAFFNFKVIDKYLMVRVSGLS